MTLDLVFKRRGEQKKKLRDLKQAFKDAFAGNARYQETIKAIEQLKIKKDQMENEVRVEWQKEIQEMDKLKLSIEADTTLLSDIAMTKLMKGETVEVQDALEQTYEPKFKVSFTKKK